MQEAPGLESEYQSYREQGLIIMALYGENTSSNPPTQSELASFAQQHNMTFPVLSDPGWNVGNNLGSGYLPAHALLAPGMTIVKKDWVYDNDIQGVLP